jgi:hypothetical protein
MATITDTHTHTRTHTHKHTHTHHTHIYTHTHTHIYIYTHRYIYIYTHTQTHTHTHIYIYIQRTLTEEEGSVQLTSLTLTSLDHLLLRMQTLITFFYKTGYLNEEVNRTEPSPSVSVPWYIYIHVCVLQGSLTETEGSVRLTSSFKVACFGKNSIMFSI